MLWGTARKFGGLKGDTMDNTISFIIPNQRIISTVKEVLLEEGLDYPVFFASTDAAFLVAKRIIPRGVKVIVSIGTTARYLQKRLDFPVLEMTFSNIEFIRAINKALSYSHKILLIASSYIAYSIQQCFDLYKKSDITLDIAEYNPDLPLLPQAEKFIERKDYDVIISSDPAVDLAVRLGKVGILYDIDKMPVRAAISNARSWVTAINAREERSLLAQAIMEYSQEGMLTTDNNECITAMNHAAETIIRDSFEHCSGRQIDDVLRERGLIDIITQPDEAIANPNAEHVIMKRVPLNMGGIHRGSVISLRDAKEIHNLEQQAQNARSKGRVAKNALDDILGDSPGIVHAKRLAKLYAENDGTVLILGESGTGKEMFAQGIHNASPRSKHAFVAVNCAALPESLLESELFGYVKGAFTGARSEGKLGVFEMADQGTIFLDEISGMSLEMQGRLLRVLQEKEIVRIGDDVVRKVDVRVISASNQNLLRLINEGHFREDLYYRLCVFELRIPPLRERREDIDLLVKGIIRKRSHALNRVVTSVSADVLEKLKKMEWRGNVRQLENLMENLIILSNSSQITLSTLNELIDSKDEQAAPDDAFHPMTLREAEEDYIRKALEYAHGNRAACARQLKIDPSTLWRRLNAEK